ncbi:hypothetical protein [Antarcticirhabdus aurantiaca]|uniref:Uncharacterized protein n=1 Tax=Antarcticirhabdus aurantiaca TaxID=2606717 RepID=A0ACD4NVH8_9HYPH|nr:hypothetical protein OXU80_12465 [Jeongeuplla avenae]
MELNDLSRLTDEQDRGHAFELRDPVHGEPTGIRLTIAGPDSKAAKKARGELERAVAKQGRRGGETPPQERTRVMDDFLFAVVIGWELKDGGKPVKFDRQNFQRLVDAGTWVRAQIDQFAGDRSPYFKAAD